MNLTDENRFMQEALRVARLGEGLVEPNPMVGCVIVKNGAIVGQGWHRQYGGPHAEVEALVEAGAAAEDATMFVTLEPCCHVGKTPACTAAIISAKISRVIAAHADPFPRVAGGGFDELRKAGISLQVGLLQGAAEQLNAPYLKRVTRGRPWVIAKWAMTLDGKIAARTGHSQWISNNASRDWVHQLRGKMDAILVGRGTFEADNPRLTARPPGPRTPVRIVLSSEGLFRKDSLLAQTAREAPVLVAVGPQSEPEIRTQIENTGAEVFECRGTTYAERLDALLLELGRRDMTNVLVEGGSRVLGTLRDAGLIDEVHVFVAGKLVGGAAAPGPCGGDGAATVDSGLKLANLSCESLDGDVHLWGRVE